ncbi:hypothetical protein CAPTEDRAFT_185694 [Capitella teleta]|uniref:Apple domain-containing protein n=1 Tax=Capitella teleta TaxID=283909 RepID=R7TG23_CAPTE|nr:hypothetical protein CAPTEDRAFT_185694 [Capitella teleta]|eukprot:ELT90496.1 hypothetical protein CAPTEDRAFT_185694 [Capitella teleta]
MNSSCHLAIVAIFVAFSTVQASRSGDLRDAAERLTISQAEKAATRLHRRSTLQTCDRFVYYANYLSYLGGELVRVGDGYSAEECQQACLSTTSFTCTAVQIHKPAECFVTGYRLRDDFFSVHYHRTCQHGPNCFAPMEGKTAGFVSFLSIPHYLRASHQGQALYCMAHCEQMDACVGFDLPRHRNTVRCAFMEMNMLPHAHFDLYMRRC